MALVDSLSRSDAGMTEKARMVVATDVGIVCDALGLHGIDPGLGRSPSCCAVSYLSARPAASAIHPLQDLVSSYVTRSIGVAAYPLSLRNVDTHVHAQDTLAT